jgi:hypothetical protein
MAGDAVDLAAKTLCPMDHTPPNLLDDPSLYVRIPEPRLTDDERIPALIAELRDRAAQFAAMERTFATNPEK